MTPAEYSQALLQRFSALTRIRETSGNSTKYTPMIEKVQETILSLMEIGLKWHDDVAVKLVEDTLKETEF
jgi:hypothetical protein